MLAPGHPAGPTLINSTELRLLARALDKLAEGFEPLPAVTPGFDEAEVAAVLERVAGKMQDNYPYFHPLYAGQMLKPPHPVARLAYALSLWVNPNNHALDGGRASSAMEKACIDELAAMFGWQLPLGHLTGGGTMANLEALWVAGRLHPGLRIVGSAHAHYTHSRLTGVLGLTYDEIRVDTRGRMDLEHVEEQLQQGDVGTLVATLGSTGLGAVDPLPALLELARKYGVRVHADAAYGGYFGLASGLDDEARAATECLSGVDSIVIDPHKHGLQPYGCGCVLFRDPSVGRFYQHDSPYTYFSSAELHLGEISLECSRPGASAVALWATHQLLPPVAGGVFAASLDASLAAARRFHAMLAESPHFLPLLAPELDIVVWAVNAPDLRAASALARRIFELAAAQNLHLATIELPADFVAPWLPGLDANADTLTCLRSVLMKPEHAEWLDPIMQILELSAIRASEPA